MKSYKVIAEGGLDMWADLKDKSAGTVRLVTDDTEFPVAHLLSQNKREVRVGVYGPTRPAALETRETGRRYKAQVVAVPQHRIKELFHLN